MNDENIKLLIANLPAIITAAGVIITAYLSYRSNQQGKVNAIQLERSNQQSEANAAQLEAVRHDVDGKLTDLLEAREDAAGARGEIKGADAQRVRTEKKDKA